MAYFSRLTVRAAKNQEQPSNSKILIISFLFTAVTATFFLSYVIVNSILDLPFSFPVEECTRTTREANEIRPVPIVSVLVMQLPNLFNILSLITDLWLVRFLHKNVLPQMMSQDADVITTISGQFAAGYSLK